MDVHDAAEIAAAAPEGGLLRAQIWWCGDDTEYGCDCTQAHIDWSENPAYPWGDQRRLWEGTYFSRDSDLEGSASEELNRMAKLLRKHHNELFHRIEWPWDREAVSG